MTDNSLSRKRSTSLLANTVSFTHTRANNNTVSSNSHHNISHDEDPRILNKANATPFGYLNKNNSSSTLHSVTQTLSNVGFTPMTPIDTSFSRSSSGSNTPVSAVPLSLAPSTNTTSGTVGSGSTTFRNPLSPTISNQPNKIENAISRAKLYAKTKTKDLKRSTKANDEKLHHHLHHHSFLKKNAHSGLSSSQSNSKLETGSTLYSFDPSIILENDVVMKHVINESNLKSLSFEEKDQMADNLWATVTRNVIKLFKVDNLQNLKLKTPIEDINRMLEVYLRLRIENNSTSTSIISEFMEFLRNGLNVLENELSFDKNIAENGVFSRISVTWDYFFKHIYHYLLGVLLPLQLEIDNPSVKNGTWLEAYTDMKLSTKNLVLVAFRDFVVLPYFETEIMIPTEMDLGERKTLVECFGKLKSVNSSSYNQKIIEHVLMLLLQGLDRL